MSHLIGQKAPDFKVSAVLGNGQIVDDFSLYTHLQNKYGIVFFYPLDFTFVCPSELLALNHRYALFKEKNTEVVAVSIDSQFTHYAWRNTPANLGGIGPLEFPMASDVSHQICRAYGIQHEALGVAYRAAFILDRNKVVRSQIVNDLPIGRNIDELLRLIDAIQFVEEYGEVCPAGWKKGEKGMQADPKGVVQYLKENADKL